MKRTLTLLVLLFLAAPGCMNFPFKQAPAPAKETATPPPAPPPVLPEEITAENAHQKAAALDKELDYDAAGHADQSSPPAPTKH